MKPLIGLTPTPELKEQEHGTFRRLALSDNYSKAVEASGGIAVMLPTHQSDVAAILDRLDGVIITGGGDIDPATYGQAPHPKTGDIDPERDEFELRILEAAIARDMPLLGICRGLQMFNVALGGTLVQDIKDEMPESVEHKQQDHRIHHERVYQEASILPGDHPMRRIASGESIGINSFHHQGIDQLAPALRAIAQTADGLIEAVYHPGMTFGLAVQWHPEMLAPTHPEHANIFAHLIDAARNYRAAQTKEHVSL